MSIPPPVLPTGSQDAKRLLELGWGTIVAVDLCYLALYLLAWLQGQPIDNEWVGTSTFLICFIVGTVMCLTSPPVIRYVGRSTAGPVVLLLLFLGRGWTSTPQPGPSSLYEAKVMAMILYPGVGLCILTMPALLGLAFSIVDWKIHAELTLAIWTCIYLSSLMVFRAMTFQQILKAVDD